MSKKCINYLVLTERELVLLLKSDDIEAFEQLYHNYKVRLYRNVLRIIKTEAKTEELLQEVFVKIWASKEDIDPDKPFRVHLFKIAESLIYEFFRKAALNKKIENHFITIAMAATNTVKTHFRYGESKPKLFEAIDELTTLPKQHIFMLREVDGRIYDKATRLPGVSISGHLIKASQTVRKFFRITS